MTIFRQLIQMDVFWWRAKTGRWVKSLTSEIEFSVRVEGSGIACGNIGPQNISAMLIEGISTLSAKSLL